MHRTISAALYADKFQYLPLAAWVLTLLLATGYQQIRKFIAFILMKFYEWFIRQNPSRL